MLPRSLMALALLAVLVCAAAAEDAYFDSDGVKIHYVTQGQGEPVILVHGFTASIPVQWQLPRIFAALAKDYRVIALDNRGHGKSDKPHDPKQYGPKMVEDVIRLMDHLKIDKAHVVGYSMGGFMTDYLLCKYPDRLLSATLGGAGWMKAGDERMAFIPVLAESLENGKGIGPLIEQLTPADRPKPSQEQIAAMNQMLLLTNDSKALAACIRGISGLAVTEDALRANKVPTLCIIGEKDPLKAGVDELAACMANLKVVVVPGADHMTAFTQPMFVNELKAFLESHAATPATAAAGGGK